ncbi:MAG: methyltransferase domain-containing protein [Candidatus Latescibacteria bacterium]|nr:methyltransferase domain-containing protein [Candidatus Latescibacterota bacterium]
MSDLFNEKAKNWDSNERAKRLSAAVGSSIVGQVPLQAQMQVMDFGAGTGLISAQVAPHVKQITAVDISEAMLEKLAAKPELHGKVEIVCRNIIDNPIDTKFDLIISAMAMHHVEDTTKLVQRFAQQLHPGGTVALADLDKEEGTFHPPNTDGVFHFGFARDELQMLFAENGFKNIGFSTAHSIDKEDRSYPVFLLVASKA